MAENELDAFLAQGEPPAAEPQPEPAPEPVAETPPEPEAPEAPEPDEESRLVPIKVVHDERRKREDWKEKAVRAETELGALKAQLEEMKRAPPPPVQAPVQRAEPQPFPPAPNPVENPAGYAEWVQAKQFNDRLQASEMVLRQEMGDAEVNARVDQFRKASANNPRLMAALQLHPDPYRFAVEQAKRIEADQAEASKREAMLKEIGTDPTAYRERLRQELMAELQTAPAAAPGRAPPAPPQFQSLAGARSVQSRATPAALTGDVPLEELFPQR